MYEAVRLAFQEAKQDPSAKLLKEVMNERREKKTRVDF